MKGDLQQNRQYSLTEPILTWNKKVSNTNLEDFRRRVSKKYSITLDDYWDLQEWSVVNFESFWEEIWIYFDMIASHPYKQVFRRTGETILDVEWFPGLLFNSAENMLRIRDDRVAIICVDELDNEEIVTYAELYEEVKLYAAAFRQNGLRKGDVVACFMSNRKEVVFIYLAAISIGAIVSGPHPFYGAKAANNIVKSLDPKFFMTIDHHQCNGEQYNVIDSLSEIISNVPSLIKVVIIPTRLKTIKKDLYAVPNCCFMDEFLSSGIDQEGFIPDLMFEQLPFSHPVAINFTSGTTGHPKAPVHSAGTIISFLVDIVLYWDLKPGDVLYSFFPFGWSVWNNYIPCLAMGMKLFLYAGDPTYQKITLNVWDLFAKYKVSYSLMLPSVLDALEKNGVQPASDADLSHLKVIFISASPVKVQNCLYLKDKVKKDLFVVSEYGTTELFGLISGTDVNLPAYAGENQAPGLGMDIKCLDNNGQITNEIGELVLALPNPSFLTHLWKDKNNKMLKQSYLSKYPGFYCLSDELVINPVTRGFKVLGRSDDTLIQEGETFRPGDIYFAIHNMEEIRDHICAGQTNNDGDTRAVLFIKMKEGYTFDKEFLEKVKRTIKKELVYFIVPQVITEVKDIPYNLNNKRMEGVVRKILATNEIPEVSNIKNPDCLKYYVNIPEVVDFMKLNFSNK